VQMNKRKLLIALTAVVACTASLLAFVLPASAQLRSFRVTLLGGRQLTVTLDVAPGTPLNQIKIPGVNVAILAIQEIPPLPLTSENPLASPQPEEETPPAQQTPQQSQPATAKGHRAHARKHEAYQPAATTPAAKLRRSKVRNADGTPTKANPTYTLALPGPAPIGVPNFFIEKFSVPPFLLPIYQAAGIEYGVRWEILAAINEIETDYGRNLNVSTAGAVGWMQFLPSTWRRYGVDANNDKRKDPYNPVDAIFSAARYLRAAGAQHHMRQAIFAYNHADWYVDSVLLRARLLGGLPADLVGSITGLTQGHFPVHAKARYADDISERDAQRRVAKGHNAAMPVTANPTRQGINIYAKSGSPVVAVQDGKIVNRGWAPRLGRFIQLRDAYGNTYTYGHLASVVSSYPVPKSRHESQAKIARELKLPNVDAAPTAPASAGKQVTDAATKVTETATSQVKAEVRRVAANSVSVHTEATVKAAKERLYAHPARPGVLAKGGRDQLLEAGVKVPGYTTFKSYFTQVFGLNRSEVVMKPLKEGSRVIAGTILGRIGRRSDTDTVSPHVLFEIRPAGRGAPRIDPKPILDGWKLLETTAIYRASGKNAFFGSDGRKATIGQILLMSKEALQRRVLDDPRVDIYSCGRRDIRAGVIDRRVLATLEFLSASGLRPSVTALKCGHSLFTKSGNVSEHSSGNAVDIAKINGIPILGHQGPGSIADLTVRRLLTLQGTLKPHQIITLMTYKGTDNTLAMADHADHVHVGFRPLYNPDSKLGRRLAAVVKPSQWLKVISRLGHIRNPVVSVKPSKFALKVARRRASGAHSGE
jgi:transglycosylase-like protein with SLT domain/peptidase M23-like protein